MKNKSELLTLLLLFANGSAALASTHINHLFHDIKGSEFTNKGTPIIEATHYRPIKMNVLELRDQLKAVTNLKTKADVVFDIPLPDGGIHRYRINENSTLSAEFAAKYPQIKTYNGYGIDNPNEYVKFDLTPQGFHAMILSPGKSAVFIDPAFREKSDYYMVYKRSDFKTRKKMRCEVPANESMSSFKYYNKYSTLADFSTCFLRQYRLAVAATTEYTNFQGGQNDALAAQTTTINRVNGVYETDLGVTLNIIGTNNLIVFDVVDNPYPMAPFQPYTSGNATAMIDQNQVNIDIVIGNGNYDIGHVFDQNSNSAGLAGLGVVCTNPEKARGVTGSISPVGDPFDIDYVAHELGHQFAANHTQNNNCNRNDPTAVEPGSGSTIMGYAGICAPNVQANSDAYFNGINLEEIGTFLTGAGGACAQTTVINSAPIVAPLSDITIPASTPFALTAVAGGPGSSDFSYAWEQQDPEVTSQPPTSTAVVGPNFRSISPVLDSTRYFPGLASLASNGPFTWEVIPTVSRSMKFRASVRANTAGGSCNAYQDMNVVVDASAGPFVLTYPSALNIQWYAGAQENIQWNTANTNSVPLNEAFVNIFLSTDGGLTYPVTLATGVPNNGAYTITVPALDTPTARVMVRASSGSFFNISENNFNIGTLPITPPTITIAARTPLSNTRAFVYYSSLGNVSSNDVFVVNGLQGASVSLDSENHRFVITSISTPRRTANVTITVLRNSLSAVSNTFTIPGIL